MHDVQRHFPFFRLSGEDLTVAEQSWYARWRALPGGEVSRIDPQLLPKWSDIPTRQARESQVHHSSNDEADILQVRIDILLLPLASLSRYSHTFLTLLLVTLRS